MKKLLTSLILVFTCLSVFSQNDQRIAVSKIPLSQVEQVVMPVQVNETLLAEEMERRRPGLPPKFAVNLETDISPNTHGNWETLSNGNALWRLHIISKNAKSLNLGFTKYKMPLGGSLILYSPDKRRVMGPFTPADNEEHEQLWTPVLDGDELVIEVQVPKEQKHLLRLELKYVNHDFIGFSELLSGSCNLDVICGAVDGWDIVDGYRDIIQSVSKVVRNGAFDCTGFLINNARQDCTPYYITANHCGFNASNATTLVSYWNFNNSTCRQPNSPESGANGDGLTSDFNSGAIWRAGWSNSDFTLLELDDSVSSTSNAFFAGWNIEDAATTDTTICVHHPRGHEKRISFEFDETYIANYSGGPAPSPNPNGTHIIVPDWDIGTTEGGSSGSPLFDKHKRVVGQLHGGAAACGNDEYDAYGRFAQSWEGGGTTSTGLKNWLDPDETGITVLDGRSLGQCYLTVNAIPLTLDVCIPAEAQFTIDVSENFQGPVNLSVNNLPAGLTATFDVNPVAPGGSSVLTISNTNALLSGSYTFRVIGEDGADSNFSDLSLNISENLPSVIGTAPANGETSVSLSPMFDWDDIFNSDFALEIATDPNFNNIVFSQDSISESELLLSMELEQSQGYFWRVKGANICGEGDWSTTYSFSTASLACASSASLDVPVEIPANGTPTVTSVIPITAPGIVDDVNVINFEIQHTWVSDLTCELTAPSGKTVQLLNNVFGGACGESDISVSFDDEAADPYSVLDGMCNTTPPAVVGDFQPFEALSEFNGEVAVGNWILKVYDESNLDGGSIDSWVLDICTIVPVDLSVTTNVNELESCLDESVSFTLVLGSGFNLVDGANLSAANLPPGVIASFDPNPALPGGVVNVTLSNAAMAGVFDITILADDGSGNGNTQIEWTVNGMPDAPTAVFPMQNAIDIPLDTAIGWSNMAGAEYEFQVATDPDFNNIILEGESSTNSVALTDLELCTHYFWRVMASDDCGDSSFSEVYSFTTEKDLSFAVGQTDFTTCNFGMLNTSLSLGQCFESSGVTLSANGLPSGASVDFSNNPVFSNDNVAIEATLTNVLPDTYTVTISGDDGVNSVSETLTLEVEGAAGLATLVNPPNTAVDVVIEPTLSWDAVAGATNYQFELATDDDFNNLVHEATVQQTSIALATPLDHLTTYYWRVTAFNDCGGTTSPPFNFTTQDATSTVDINELQLEILPNPTHGLLFIKSSAPLNEQIEINVFSIDGKRLLEKTMGQGTNSTSLDLTGYPSGIYVVRLASGSMVVAKRVVVE